MWTMTKVGVRARSFAAGCCWLALATALLSACGGRSSDPGAPDGAQAAELRRVVDTLLSRMENEALHRARIDWPGLRAAALQRLGSEPSVGQAEAAMSEALSGLPGTSSRRMAAGWPGATRPALPVSGVRP